MMHAPMRRCFNKISMSEQQKEEQELAEVHGDHPPEVGTTMHSAVGRLAREVM